MGHRYYLPRFGRFLTPDPLGHEAGLNLYEYAENNPLRNVDPDGLQAEAVLPWIGRAAAVGAASTNPIGAAAVGFGVALYGAYQLGNYLASHIEIPTGAVSPLSQYSVLKPGHIGSKHGAQWGMPSFNPKDPGDLAKLTFKLTAFATAAENAIAKGLERWASIPFTYFGNAQTLYLHASGRFVILQGKVITNAFRFDDADAVKAFFSSSAGGRVVPAGVVDAALKKIGWK